jgi:hypothetical protein
MASRTLTFKASQRMPEGYFNGSYAGAPRDAMTFQDLCFYSGNEAIPEGYQVDTFTKQRDGTKLTDLGWLLPSRFVDALVDALGRLNDTMLGGTIGEAILYGIVTKP